MADTYNMSDVFISYSRKDTAFVRRVFDALKAHEKEVWADFEDIPKAADWWEEIKAGIQAANAFVFIISPDSVRSDICRREIDTAVEANKRLIPMLYREITEAADKDLTHTSISAHNWIFAREADDFDKALETLLQTLDTDLEHNRDHTRLLVRAREWEQKNKNTSYLLRGEELVKAESWLAQAVSKTPSPSSLHLEYVNMSRRKETDQQRRILGFMTAGFAVSLVLAILALVMWQQANEARGDAEKARDAAYASERKARSLGLTANAQQALYNADPDLALALAMKAAEIDDTQPGILNSLADAVYSPGTAKLIITNGAAIFATAYSADGEWVAEGDERGRICAWEVNTSAEIFCIDETIGHSAKVVGMAFNQTHGWLVTASEDGTTRTWSTDPQSPQYLNEIARFTCEPVDAAQGCKILSMALSPDGDVALFGTDDGQIGAWNPLTGELLTYMDKTYIDAPIRSLAISPSGLRALSGSDAGTVVHWYIRKGAMLTVLPARTSTEIYAVAFNPDGQQAVSGDRDGLIQLWDLRYGEPLRGFTDHRETVTSLVFAPGGQSLFSTSWDTSIIEWNVDTGRPIRTFYGHDGGVNSLQITTDGHYLVSGGFDTNLRIWSVLNYLTVKSYSMNNNWIQGIVYNTANQRLFTAQSGGDVLVLDATTGNLARAFRGYGENAQDVALTPDGKYMAVVYNDNRLMLRGTTEWERLWSIDTSTETTTQPYTVLFSPDGQWLIVGFYDGWAWYETTTGNVLGKVRFGYDETTQRQISLRAIALHPDGTQLLVGLNSRSDNLQLVDFATGEVIRTFSGHTDGVLAVAFNADGTQAVSGSFDNAVRLWDVASGTKVGIFSGHTDRITTIAFSPDGTKIASGGNDQTVRLWSVADGVSLYRYTGHTGRITEVIFSADGQYMFSGARDGEVIMWRLPQSLAEMVTLARENRFIRDLTCTEQVLYLSEELVCED